MATIRRHVRYRSLSRASWRPRESWTSGLEKTIAWYTENAGWIERVRTGDYREYYAEQYADAGMSRGPAIAGAAS